MNRRSLLLIAVLAVACAGGRSSEGRQEREKRLLYVASPGIRNYLEYGGAGLLVFDIDDGHKFVKRIPTAGSTDPRGSPDNVKGVCATRRPGGSTSARSRL